MKKIMAVLIIIMLFSTVAVAENLATPTDLYDHMPSSADIVTEKLATPTDLYDHMIFPSDAVVKISAAPTKLCDHVWNEWILLTDTKDLTILGYESVDKDNHEVLYSGTAEYIRACAVCGSTEMYTGEKAPDDYTGLLEAHEILEINEICGKCGYGEPVEEPSQEPAEEPAEEPSLEPAEEPVKEPSTEPAEEPAINPVQPTVKDNNAVTDPKQNLQNNKEIAAYMESLVKEDVKATVSEDLSTGEKILNFILQDNENQPLPIDITLEEGLVFAATDSEIKEIIISNADESISIALDVVKVQKAITANPGAALSIWLEKAKKLGEETASALQPNYQIVEGTLIKVTIAFTNEKNEAIDLIGGITLKLDAPQPKEGTKLVYVNDANIVQETNGKWIPQEENGIASHWEADYLGNGYYLSVTDQKA